MITQKFLHSIEPDILFPTNALLPLSGAGGGNVPLPHMPRMLRPLGAALGVAPVEAGKHDTTATRWTEDKATQKSRDGVVEPDRFLLQQREPAIQGVWRVDRDGAELLCVQARDGAWAEIDVIPQHGHHAVAQGGPRRIWDRIEPAATLWRRLGQPCADRFGLTVTAGHQRLWLDTPESHGLVVVGDAFEAGW